LTKNEISVLVKLISTTFNPNTMKKITLSLILFIAFSQCLHAQWVTDASNNMNNTNTGNVGVGTTSLSAKFSVYQAAQLGAAIKNFTLLTSTSGSTAANALANNVWLVRNAAGGDWTTARLHDGISVDASFLTPQVNTTTWWERDPSKNIQSWGNAASTYLTINNGNVGIGTTTPLANLHVLTGGTSIDAITQTTAPGLIIQANTGSRSATTGAQLEFAIPANTDGTNIWSQARILTVAGNAANNNATGKMIMGTRRSFDKLGTGVQWYYGNDLVIDALGNVGIGTLTPREALSVNGNIRAKQVKVEALNWPDYVFKKDYQLPSLSSVKSYIDQNQHLPDMPSEQEITQDGVNLGEMNKLLVKKVEELTLYLIEKDQEKKAQEATNARLQGQIDLLLKKVDQLSKKSN
jgi:hypothetical protein